LRGTEVGHKTARRLTVRTKLVASGMCYIRPRQGAAWPSNHQQH